MRFETTLMFELMVQKGSYDCKQRKEENQMIRCVPVLTGSLRTG